MANEKGRDDARFLGAAQGMGSMAMDEVFTASISSGNDQVHIIYNL